MYIEIDKKKYKENKGKNMVIGFFLLRCSVFLKKGIIFISMFLFYYYCYKIRNLNDIERGIEI